jgi:hypothetical protein
MSEETVKWPAGKAYDESAEDLGLPIRNLLYGLRLLENPKDEGTGGAFKETPQSLQVLTSGATSVTKLYAALATAVGGGSALLGGITAFWGSFKDKDLQQAVLMASAAVLGSAVVIAVAVMVRGDVSGRARAHAAEYEARAAVATAMIDSIKSAMPVAPVVRETRYSIRKNGEKTWHQVKAFELSGGRVIAKTQGDEVPSAEWTDLAKMEDLAN